MFLLRKRNHFSVLKSPGEMSARRREALFLYRIEEYKTGLNNLLEHSREFGGDLAPAASNLYSTQPLRQGSRKTGRPTMRIARTPR